ncbi:MAG: hypothetical protein QNJ36_04410 [Calothrix sp. MO_167.B42]|nr:hypothetical protein [Calothrix sp. MO_167.B42]
MKLNKIVILLLLSIQFAAGTKLVQAGEADKLYNLCSKFPYNSQCQDYKVPIPLDKRPGNKARCLLSGNEKAKNCKVNLTEDSVNFYFETGDSIAVLDGQKGTKKVGISFNKIKSLSYSEKKKTDVGAVLAFGLWGLLAKKKTSTISIRFQQEVEETKQQQAVFVTRRSMGRKMRQELEKKTDLTVDLLDI